MSTASIAQRHALHWPRLTVRGVLDVIADADARYRDRVNLGSLDERLLRDIGITRADVDAELRGGSIW
jgi:uncharacterized protein YjiS (DUF1127 family)